MKLKKNVANIIEKIKSKFNIKNTKTLILALILLTGILFATVVLVFSLFIIISAPDFKREKLYHKESTTIYALDGSELAKIGESNLTAITYDDLPEVLIDAIISTEDSRFFQHKGLDAARFLKASFGQVLGSSSGGASTISMQVVKNTYTSSKASGIKGIIRKFTDIYMAIFKIENAYTKEEILEFYFNSQWLGYDGNVNYTSISGVEQASEFYFGKSVRDLSLPEASLLAGMFQNPVAYNPYKFPEKAKARQKTVLNLMHRHKYITKSERDDALKIEIPSLLKEASSTTSEYPQAAIDYVLKEAERLTGKSPHTTPMKIYSTIDVKTQNALSDIEDEKNYQIPEARGDIQFGIAITSVEDGSIKALSGGRNYQAKGNNRALSRRQPGSTAKPIFDFGPYFEYLNGSPYSMFLDEPVTYTSGEEVNNWDRRYFGLITAKTALSQSRNTSSLRAFKEVFKKDKKLIEEFAHNLGIDYGEALYESASIGGFDGVSPLEMSAAYAAFGREGYYIKPYSVNKIELLENGKVITNKYTKVKVMSPETAYMITDILIHSTRTFVGGVSYGSSQIASKSGTTTIDEKAMKALGLPSTAIMDSWTASYSSKQSIALWIGYDKLSKEYHMTSNNIGAVRVGLSREIAKTHENNLTFKIPSGIIYSSVELETFPAMLPSEFTPSDMIIKEYFKKGTEPSEVSPRYDRLEDVSGLKSSVINGKITLKWNHAPTPKPIDTDYLVDHFNTYYENHASKYFEKRLNYNSSFFGELGYDIYLIDKDKETPLARVSDTSFSYNIGVDQDYEFLIKTSLSKFKANASSGVKIKIKGSTNQEETPTNTNNNDDFSLD